MALSIVKRDKRWVFASDTITINATYTVGNRFRTYLYNKPVKSALVVSDPDDPTYLPNNEFTPDVAGCYSIIVVEETYSQPPSHFSNDLGTTDPITTKLRGVEDVTTVDTYTYTFTVCERVTRAIGMQPDTVTLTCVDTCDDWVQAPATWPFVSHTYGAITRYIDTSYMPVLSEPSSDAARIAMGDTSVVRAVADIGGQGNPIVYYGQREAIETTSILSWDTIADSAIIANLGWTILRFNNHVATVAINVHAFADVANVITEPACDLTEPTQRALMNEMLTALGGHAANTGANYHHDVDTVCVADLAGVAALPNPSTLAQRIARANLLFNAMDSHFARRWLASTTLTYAHWDMADNHMAWATLYPAYDVTTVRDIANAMRTGYIAHIAKVTPLAANYHAAGGGANYYLDTWPTDRDNYIKAVSKLLTLLQAHVTNIDSTTGGTVGYHATADWTSRTDMIGQPTDYTSAVIAHEAFDWFLSQHASKGTTTHGMTQPGQAAERPFGVEMIHHAFRTACMAAVPTIPTNENYAAAKMVLTGGFTSAG